MEVSRFPSHAWTIPSQMLTEDYRQYDDGTDDILPLNLTLPELTHLDSGVSIRECRNWVVEYRQRPYRRLQKQGMPRTTGVL